MRALESKAKDLLVAVMESETDFYLLPLEDDGFRG